MLYPLLDWHSVISDEKLRNMDVSLSRSHSVVAAVVVDATNANAGARIAAFISILGNPQEERCNALPTANETVTVDHSRLQGTGAGSMLDLEARCQRVGPVDPVGSVDETAKLLTKPNCRHADGAPRAVSLCT